MKDGISLAAYCLRSQPLVEHYGARAMLFTLLIGMTFASKTLFRIVVALLGIRLSLTDISKMGARALADNVLL